MKSLIKKKSFGQSAVEFALILPILITLLAGMMELGRLVFIYISVFNAAREAARYGQVTAEIGSIKQYQDCDGIRGRALDFRFISDYSASDISITFDQGPGTPLTPECDLINAGVWGTITTGSRINVTINSLYNPVIPFVPLNNINIVSTSSRTILGNLDVTP